MTLGERLIQYRKENKLSQRQLGDLCGLSNAYISMIEKNLNPRNGKPFSPSMESLYKISTGTGIEFEEILMCAKVNDTYDPSEFLSSNATQMGKIQTPALRKQLLDLINQLNTKGLNRAMLIIEDLTKVPEYQKVQTTMPLKPDGDPGLTILKEVQESITALRAQLEEKQEERE